MAHPQPSKVGGIGLWRVGVSRGGGSLCPGSALSEHCFSPWAVGVQRFGQPSWQKQAVENTPENSFFLFFNPDGVPKTLHVFSGLCQPSWFKDYIAPVAVILLQNSPGDQGRWPSLLSVSGLGGREGTGSCLDSCRFWQCAGWGWADEWAPCFLGRLATSRETSASVPDLARVTRNNKKHGPATWKQAKEQCWGWAFN